jgi:RNA polymerase sigma-70 factor (ECF subfamily)
MTEGIRDSDADSFAELIERHRRELHAHCFRMLGSVHDADDALQEALLGAWKGRSGFEGRSSLRSWLHTIATNASLRVLEGRRRRAVLLLRDVLGFSARETAEILATSVASVNSALQRARAKLERKRPARSQQETLRALGDERSRELVTRFVDAWNRADVSAIVAMLREDATFTMPPLPTCFQGKDDIAAFLTARVFRSTWRFGVTSASGQPAMVGHRRDPDSGRYELRALTVLTFEGELIAAMTAFLGPGVLGRFRPAEILPPPDDFRS